MARINTNINSLIAQNRLERSNQQLQLALTRLSTGLRINTGKDDPAGLIASEALRSDILNSNRAIANAQRAESIIATADSALGQVSSLLNTIKGLVVETANQGALSIDQVNANQLQIDSALEAINRIALTTTFQGSKLLDGSLDFHSNIGSVPAIVDSWIEQADLGASGSLSVEVNVLAQATQANLINNSMPSTFAQGTLRFPVRSSTILGDIQVQAVAETQPVTIEFLHSDMLPLDSVEAAYDPNTRSITITAHGSSNSSITKSQLAAAIDGLTDFTAVTLPGTEADSAGDFSSGGVPPASSQLDETSIETSANQAGAEYNHVLIELVEGNSTGAQFDAVSKRITVSIVPGSSTLNDIADALDGLSEFTVTARSNAGSVSTTNDLQTTANSGFTGGAALRDSLVFELSGMLGTESYHFQANSTAQQIADAINLNSDTTGVAATYQQLTGELLLNSVAFGSNAFVNLRIISEGPQGTFAAAMPIRRSTGTDIVANVNGIAAAGQGHQLAVNSSTLTLSLVVEPSLISGPLRFQIGGGGALFQLGGDIVSDHQARLGIQSLSVNTLGGPSGRLFELGSGYSKSLDRDIHAADRVIEQVINKVSSLRGRLGAFQQSTLESGRAALADAVSNLTEAESSIRDADFAKETALLSRAQILMQSGISVLGIANQNPQNILRLLER